MRCNMRAAAWFPGRSAVSDGHFVRSDAPVSVNPAPPIAHCVLRSPPIDPHMWLDTLLSIVSILVPRPIIAPMAAIEINDATSAYSIAVAAFEQRTIFLNSLMTHSEVNNLAPLIRDLEQGGTDPAAEMFQLMVKAEATGRSL